MSSLSVGSGHVSSGLSLGSGDSITVFNGGSAVSTTIGPGALLTVSLGGVASEVFDQGSVVVAGGFASTLEIDGGSLFIGSGGVADVVFFASSAGVPPVATVTVAAGGTLNSAYLSYGGQLLVQSGGVADGILDGGAMIVSGGLAGNVDMYGGTLLVAAGGVAEYVSFGPGAGALAGSVAVTVASGGQFVSAFLDYAAQVLVQPGGVAAGIIDQGLMTVGGFASGVNVNGGTLAVAGGGVAENVSFGTVSGFGAGGLAIVSSGGVLAGANIGYGGGLTVQSGGFASEVVVTQGELFVQSGGFVSNTVLAGNIRAASAALAGRGDGIVVGSGARLAIYAGGFASGVVVSALGTLDLAGGVAVAQGGSLAAGAFVTFNTAAYVLGSGQLIGPPTLDVLGTVMPAAILSGYAASDVLDLRDIPFGSDVSTLFNAHERLTISAGGQQYSLQFANSRSLGAVQFDPVNDGAGGTTFRLADRQVSAGFVASGLQVRHSMTVLPGGSALDSWLNDGNLLVESGGTALGTSASVGSQTVLAGGTASGTVLAYYSAFEFVYGRAVGTVISAGSQIDFGAVSGTVIGSNGINGWLEVMPGATATGTVNSGGYERVHSGAAAAGETVAGYETVDLGAAVSAVTLLSGGHLRDYGAAAAPVIGSGATLDVASGAAATQVDIASGGVLWLAGGTVTLSPGGAPAGAQINFVSDMTAIGVIPGAAALVISGSAMPGAVISNFGAPSLLAQVIDLASVPFDANGSASLGAGNAVTITEGGSAFRLQLDPAQDFGGQQFNLAPDGGSGTQITVGNAEVLAGQTVTGAVVSFGRTMIVESGGIADAAVVNGGTLIVSSGGVASGASLSASAYYMTGSLQVLAGGVALGVLAGSGGMVVVQSGGSAFGVVVDGGSALVRGAASGTVVSSGYETLVSGGTETSGLILAGGWQVVSGGTALGTQAASGGTIAAEAGGSVADPQIASGGELLIAGGTAIVASGGLAPGAVVQFAPPYSYSSGIATGSGTLAIAGAAMPGAVIGGFNPSGLHAGNMIDLLAVPFDAAGTASFGANNVLTVAEGGQSYTLAFDPAQSFADESIVLSPDGHGGTDIGAGPLQISSGQVVSGLAITDGQQVTVLSGGLAAFAVVSSGGVMDVASGGATVSDTLSYGGVESVAAGGRADFVQVGIGGLLYVASGGSADFAEVARYGSIDVAGTLSSATIGAGGWVEADPGGVAGIGGFASGGTLLIAGGTAVLSGAAAASGASIRFAASGGTLEVLGAATVPAALSGFALSGLPGGDAVDLAGLAFVSGGTATLGAGNVVTLSEGGAGGALTLDPNGIYSFDDLRLLPDGLGGTLLVYAPRTESGGAVASGTVVGPGQELIVSGGTASGLVAAGGTIVLTGGATGVGLAVSGGQDGTGFAAGAEFIESGAADSGTIVSNGAQTVSSGGSAVDTQMIGGTQFVLAGGVVSGTVLSSWSSDLVAGTLTAAIVGSDSNVTVLAGGVAEIASVTGGRLSIEGGTIVLAPDAIQKIGGIPSTSAVSFTAAGGTLELPGSILSAAFVNGFDSPNQTIDLLDVPYVADGAAVLGSGNLLTVTEGAAGFALAFATSQSFAGDAFVTLPDGHGGTDVQLACYALGTRIATPAGEARIEELRVGDMVLALGGARAYPRAVRWTGRVTLDLRRHQQPEQAAPVRIRAHAFADGVPHRDLLLSPDHAVLVQGGLIHVRNLIDGDAIAQEFPDRITYLHVELDAHGILLAEGLPAESYLDLGHRGLFAGEMGTRPLHPDMAAAAWDARACAPLILDGPRLAAAQAMLRKRALLRARAGSWRGRQQPARRGQAG